MRITNRSVEALHSCGKDQFAWDDNLRGFGLKVTRAGSKVYLVQYRRGGRGASTQRYTIGRHGSPWMAPDARAEARRILLLVDGGHDPRQIVRDRERDARELRFDTYAHDFIERFAKPKWAPRTVASHASNFRRWIIPAIGSKPLPEINRRDIAAVFDRLPPKSPALPGNIFALMRKLFNRAVERGDLTVSPMNGLKSPSSPPARKHVLTDPELLFVCACAPELGPLWEQWFTLLVLTGQRRSEVAGMHWEELDRENALWSLPEERTKNSRRHEVPLSNLAIIELDRHCGSSSWPTRGLVFTTTGDSPISGFSRVKRRLDAIVRRHHEELAVRPWTFHDLRRTVATNLQRLGVRSDVTEAVLNHVSSTETEASKPYLLHDWADEKRDALQAWADALQDRLEKLYPE